MAFQKGLIKLKGTIGDLTFYKTRNNGYQAREKTGVDAARIASDPNFERTRENNSEFRRAANAAKLFRTVFRNIIVKGADSTLSNRLTTAMMRVVKADGSNDRGLRQVLDAETEMLVPFEFNANGLLGSSIYMPYTGAIDRLTGKLTVTIPEFVPKTSIVAPDGASHFKLRAAAAMINFETRESEFSVHETEPLLYNSDPLELEVMECQLAPAHQNPLFLALGIDFYQRVNGKDYPLNNGARNGLCLIHASGQ